MTENRNVTNVFRQVVLHAQSSYFLYPTRCGYEANVRSKPIHEGGVQRFRTRHTPSVQHYTLNEQKRKEFFVQKGIVSQNSHVFYAKMKNVRVSS